jgi:hypothetical protein
VRRRAPLLASLAAALLLAAPRSVAGGEGPLEVAATSWLQLLDQGRFDEAWREAADLLRSGGSAQDWIEATRRLREKYGAAESRELLAKDYHQQFDGAPDGIYFTLRYRTHFSSGDQIELVTLTPDVSQRYRVGAYGIKR